MAATRVTKAEIEHWLSRLDVSLSPAQAAPVYDTESDVILVAGGVGGGKSFVSAMFVVPRLPYAPLVWIVGPDYEQTKAEFNELHTHLKKLGLVESASTPLRGPRSIRTRLGGVIETKTSSQVEKIASKGPNIIVMSEAAQQTEDAFLVCVERVTRAEHPEYKRVVFLSGTFEESRPWYGALYDTLSGDNYWDGQAYSIPTWANLHLFPDGYDDPVIQKRLATFPEDRFLARFGGQRVKPAGLVIKEFDVKTHVSRDVTFDPSLPVEVWIDPGYSGSSYAVEAVQFPRGPVQIHVFDEIYVRYATHREVIELAKRKPWWSHVVGGVSDIAARQHAAAPSCRQRWLEAGVPLRSQYVRVEDNIQRHRTFLEVNPASLLPRLMLSPNCKGAIMEYGRWLRKKDASSGEWLSQPSKMWCDALKAIGYGVIDHFGYERAMRRRPQRRQQ